MRRDSIRGAGRAHGEPTKHAGDTRARLIGSGPRLGGCTLTRPHVRIPAAAEPLIEWRTVETPDGAVRLAIARPNGEGPFPAAIILHGRHGFAQEYVTLASDLAAEGVIGVAACWFDGGGGAGARFITPLECAPGAPSAPDPAVDPRARTIAVLVRSVRDMQNVSAVALVGHSRGGWGDRELSAFKRRC